MKPRTPSVWTELRSLMDSADRHLSASRVLGRFIAQHRARSALRAISRRGLTAARILGPSELAAAVPNLVPYARSFDEGEALQIEAAIVRLDRVGEIDARLLGLLRREFVCCDVNPLYAVFRRGRQQSDAARGPLVETVDKRLEEMCIPANRGHAAHLPPPPSATPGDRQAGRRAIVVTTFNRPAALRRTLPQLAALGVPIAVVDDGSPREVRDRNRAICEEVGASYLELPENRGLAAALNTGLCYLLADPSIKWISYFQDDVDVRRDTLEQLAALEHPDERPLLTGFDAEEHPVVDVVEIAGISAKLKRSTPGVHLHGHAEYWASVMPIPSPYLGAPKRQFGDAMIDWWIVNHAPRAVQQRGLCVVCVPGLVRTFLWHHDDSTWGNPTRPNPPLPSVPYPGTKARTTRSGSKLTGMRRPSGVTICGD